MRRFVKLSHATAAQETIARKSRCPGAGSAGRQHMAWTGGVIAQRDGGVVPQERRAAVAIFPI